MAETALAMRASAPLMTRPARSLAKGCEGCGDLEEKAERPEYRFHSVMSRVGVGVGLEAALRIA